MGTFSYNKLILMVISNIIVTSSFGQNLDKESRSVCKSMLLENCSETFCTVDIKMINKCSKNSSSDDETKKKCENFVEADFLNDTFLFRPVTNELENVTYLNMYCALCNGERLPSKYLKFWTLRAYHRGHSGSNSISFVSDVDLAVVENIRVDNNTQQLISSIDDFVGNVVPLRYLPSGLSNSSYHGCSLDTSESTLGVILKNNTELLSSVPEGFDCTGKKFCSRRELPEPEVCVYLDRNNLGCNENRFLVERIDFVYNGSEIILSDGRIFDSDVYSNFIDNVIFLCDSKDDRHPAKRIFHEFIEYMKYVSAFFLFLFLIVKTNSKNFKSLPKLILHSYCVATFAIYLYRIFHHLIAGRMIYQTCIFLYVYLCQALWMMIISYEYWFVISRAFKFKKARTEIKTYRIYGFIGWVLPALLLCIVYLSLTAEDKSAVCPRFANYSCITIHQYLSEVPFNLYLALILLYVLIFLIATLIVSVQGCNLIRLARNKRHLRRLSAEKKRMTKNSTRGNNSERDYLLIFIKIAYLMGCHWMLICMAVIVSSILEGPAVATILGNVGSFLFACHGTFIFFAFGFETVRTKYTSTYQSFKTMSSRSSVVESCTVDMNPAANVNELEGGKEVG